MCILKNEALIPHDLLYIHRWKNKNPKNIIKNLTNKHNLVIDQLNKYALFLMK